LQRIAEKHNLAGIIKTLATLVVGGEVGEVLNACFVLYNLR
jgi:hypothetical protein